MFNEPLLDEKLANLEKVRKWSPRVISKLEALIRTPKDEELYRINPLLFSKEKGIDETECLDLFLHV